jgi:hypothetical protein
LNQEVERARVEVLDLALVWITSDRRGQLWLACR